MKKHSKKLIAAVTLAASLVAAPSAFALNEAGSGNSTGTKAFNFNGYQFVDGGGSDDTLYLYLDKDVTSPGEIVSSMFKAKKVSDGSGVTLTYGTLLTNGSYSGTNDTSLKGTRVALTGNFAQDTLYEVEISGYLMNKNGITLGNYYKRKPIKFVFKTPDANGAYTGNPYVTYLVGDGTTGISRESNMIAVFDRPYYASGASSFLTAMEDGFLNTTPNPDVEVVSNGECYSPIFNDADSSHYGTTNGRNTTVFFQETKSGSATTIYNRASGSNTYTLTLPGTFYDVNNRSTNTYDGGGSSFSFTTASTNYPGWEMNNSVVSGANQNITVNRTSATNLEVKWYDTWANEDPASYDVYYINSLDGDNYAGLSDWILAGTASATGTSEGQEITFNISDSVDTPVEDGQTYWVRIAPNNSSGIKAGFSKSNDAAD